MLQALIDIFLFLVFVVVVAITESYVVGFFSWFLAGLLICLYDKSDDRLLISNSDRIQFINFIKIWLLCLSVYCLTVYFTH